MAEVGETESGNQDLLVSAAGDLVGLECWGIYAGEGTGSRFDLHLGARIRRVHPLRNPYLTEDEKSFDGAYSVFVQECPWRLEDDAGVITSWIEDDANDGPMVRGLARVRGRTVVAAEVSGAGHDLRLTFDGGITLHVFPHSTPRTEDDRDDYSLFTPTVILTVHLGGQIVEEERILDEP